MVQYNEHHRHRLPKHPSTKVRVPKLNVLQFLFRPSEDDEEDDNIFRPRIVLSLLYNVALTSKITNSDIIAKTRAPGDISGLNDVATGDWKDMILREKRFTEIHASVSFPLKGFFSILCSVHLLFRGFELKNRFRFAWEHKASGAIQTLPFMNSIF